MYLCSDNYKGYRFTEYEYGWEVFGLVFMKKPGEGNGQIKSTSTSFDCIVTDISD